ncbi:hypothetical protein C8Q73DRAFT_709975 [Cubamyces lactineus]|nr:hypothetical protein C8Q73DRAFT_709975 [Cubamyces lactineus]
MPSGAADHSDSPDSDSPSSALAAAVSQDNMTLIIHPQEALVGGHGHALTVVVPRNHTLTIVHGHDGRSGAQKLTLVASGQSASAHSEDTNEPIPRSAVDADTPLSPSLKRITDDDLGNSFSSSTHTSASAHGGHPTVDASSSSSGSPIRPTRSSARVSRRSSQFSTEDDVGEPRAVTSSKNNSSSPIILPHSGWVASLFEEPQADEGLCTDGEDDS